MHRLVWIVLSSLVVVVLAGAPALAQQDPFEPRNPGGGTGGQPTQPSPGQPGTGGNQQAQEPSGTGQTTEGLPNTGADPKPWIVLAYGLIFIGAALVTLSRTLRVSPVAGSSGPPSPADGARSAGSSR